MNRVLLPLIFVLSLLICPFSYAKDDEDDDDADDDDEESYVEILGKCESFPGLFPLYQDREDGTVYLEISEDQIGKEFIHFSHTLDGVAGLGFFRGQFGPERIFKPVRHFDRIEFVAENTSFYFRPDSALSRASQANVSDAVLASEEIAASSDDGTKHLVKADSVFLKEFFRQLKPADPDDDDDKKKEFKLGDLSDDRTRFLELKNFPDNTLFRVQYVYEDETPKKEGDADVVDSRYVTLRVQHTLIAVPENDYEPRFDDPRVGYFTTQVTDLTSKSSAPYRDFINRWNLKKKDPTAEVSDPVEPILFWMENTTPVELRDTIRDAVLRWNLAFADAGFSNAVEVRMQPDDAEWDADDIHYNVLRWTSSPDPPFGGYGPSFVNPRTGQIIGADIMLEYVFLTNRVKLRRLIGPEGRDSLPFPWNRRLNGPGLFCQAGNHLQIQTMAAKAGLVTTGNDPLEVKDLLEQALIELVLHEVGHTLGLSHNFKASYLHDRETIHNKDITSVRGTAASVMDYVPVNLALDRSKQGHYYPIVPGPYDHWVIRYGYSEVADKEEEAELLDSILAASTLPEHMYGNDADDMRRAGRGIDPRAMINDLTNEPIENAIDTITFATETMNKLSDAYPKEGASYEELVAAFTTLTYIRENAVETMTRFVGGVEVDRSAAGQKGAAPTPFVPVPVEQQKKALDALAKYVFAADAFAFPPDLLASLQMQRRGFSFYDLKDNEDPKIHEAVFEIQKQALNQLLHKNTLTRLLDSSLYGNEMGMAEVMDFLHQTILSGDPGNEANTFRQALQIEYVERLIKISGLKDDSDFPPQARGKAVELLESWTRLDNRMTPAYHKAHLTRLITNALEGR